jgi:small-conductance mechanosensitive channel
METLWQISQDQLIPAIILIIGFPLLMILSNEWIRASEAMGGKLLPTARSIRRLVIPTLAIWIFLRWVAKLPDDHLAVRIAATFFWISVLIAVLNLTNDAIFGNANLESWQGRIPKFFRDLTRLALIAVGAAIIYSLVWNQNISVALTTLGLGSIVIGLALQEPLGNIVSGMMLLFERPLNIGDWVNVGGVVGKVIEINWRSVHIQTPTMELQIVPNVSLYKDAFTNLSRPTTMRTDLYEVGFSYDHPPNRVKQLLLEMLKETPGVLKEPPPRVRTVNYADFSIIYRLIFSVESQEMLPATRDEVITRIWYVAKREGLNIPFPIQLEYGPSESISTPEPTVEERLAAYPRFQAALVPDFRAHEEPRTRQYAAGEVLLRAGEPSQGISLIVSGGAVVQANGGDGNPITIDTLDQGEFFGEYELSGEQPSEVTVVATSDLVAIHFPPDSTSRLLEKSPALSQQVGEALLSRRKAARAARTMQASRSSDAEHQEEA